MWGKGRMMCELWESNGRRELRGSGCVCVDMGRLLGERMEDPVCLTGRWCCAGPSRRLPRMMVWQRSREEMAARVRWGRKALGSVV